MKENQKELYCTLAFDEMHIKGHVEWLHESKKFSGLITYGRRDSNEKLPIAKQALVFLITCHESKLSIPVAHYFIDNLDTGEKTKLLFEVVRCLRLVGVCILNITFDGLPTNRSMCEGLGASFDANNIIPFIEIDNENFLIIFDPPHMLKCIRNSLGKYRQFHSNGKLISWRYIERLETYRVNNNFVSHKLTKAHIQWNKNQMNVRLAAQTFSRSVANSIDYLRNEEHVMFSNSAETIKFISCINDLFDIFNAKHSDSTSKFRRGLSSDSATEIFDFLNYASDYIKSLRIGWRNVVQSRIQVGFIGFLVNIEALKILYNQYILTGNIDIVHSFYLGQDLLESFFGRIRARHGRNDNPTVTQFCAAFRALLVNLECTASNVANCKDALNILTIPSTSKPPNSVLQTFSTTTNSQINIDSDDDTYNDLELNQMIENHSPIQSPHQFEQNNLENATIAYFTGIIEKKIQGGRFECDEGECNSIFERNEEIDSNMVDTKFTQKPCLSSFRICQIVHKLFGEHSKKVDFNYKKMLDQIKQKIPFNDLYPETDFAHDIGHKVYFVNYFIDEYVRHYGHYLAKHYTLEQHQWLLRQKLHKQIHERNL